MHHLFQRFSFKGVSSMSNIPADLLYSKSHEWVRVDGDTVTIGITDHAQEELGDVVYASLPTVGRVLSAEDVFGTVESVKAVSDLYSPLSGEVVEVNSALEDDQTAINGDPYGAAWMLKLRLTDASQLSALMDADAYRTEIGE
jgi:glycine cleavage system H protein